MELALLAMYLVNLAGSVASVCVHSEFISIGEFALFVTCTVVSLLPGFKNTLFQFHFSDLDF